MSDFSDAVRLTSLRLSPTVRSSWHRPDLGGDFLTEDNKRASHCGDHRFVATSVGGLDQRRSLEHQLGAVPAENPPPRVESDIAAKGSIEAQHHDDHAIWVPKKKGETRKPNDIPDGERDYYLERRYPSFGNLVPRDVASRNAKEVCDEGRGVGPGGHGVYLDFRSAIERLGLDNVRDKYGNLFEIYERITGDDAYQVPMRIYPAPHYTMGGLWVDYHLMSTIPGLFVGGEANFSDQGANRLGASALMQGLSDGYFILPATVPDYLAKAELPQVDTSHPAFREAEEEVRQRTSALLRVNGQRTVDSFHRELGRLMWDDCGMARSDASLRRALGKIPELRDAFGKNVRVLGTEEELNQSLEKAGRVADFLELAELMCTDALHRTESCGGHFRIESQTAEGEAKRDDANFCYVAAWEWKGPGQAPALHKEPLTFEHVHLAQRSYK